jgi:DNA mismatch repair protein MutH
MLLQRKTTGVSFENAHKLAEIARVRIRSCEGSVQRAFPLAELSVGVDQLGNARQEP